MSMAYRSFNRTWHCLPYMEGKSLHSDPNCISFHLCCRDSEISCTPVTKECGVLLHVIICVSYCFIEALLKSQVFLVQQHCLVYPFWLQKKWN